MKRASRSRPSEAVIVLVTCPTTRHAHTIARELIRQHRAACVNILPGVTSLFRWQGRVDQAREALLIVKTPSKQFEPLRQLVCSLHPYEVPEVIAFPLRYAHQPYLKWLLASV